MPTTHLDSIETGYMDRPTYKVMDRPTYKVGDAVEFHSEWPFAITYGRVLEVGERVREFCTSRTETYVKVEWEDRTWQSKEENERNRITTVPTWNARLRQGTLLTIMEA
jgi:hypothetical protein